MALTQEMKDWFGDGEWDVDLMLSYGMVTEKQIIEMFKKEHGMGSENYEL